MKTVVIAACVACLVHARIADGQSITAEAAVTAGYSTDDPAVGAQLRVFGDVKGGIRFFGEIASGKRFESEGGPQRALEDSFGAAYPYTENVQIIEAYAERMFRPRGAVLGVRGGRFRPPFGIYSASDHAYTGFLRAPLIRYDGYSALSNNYLEHGADLVVGIPRLTVETALGAPADVGAVNRRSGVDTVVRVQGYYGPFIVGASHIRTSPYQSPALALGRTDFTGIDLRWMYNGVQLRGEWMTGRPFDGTTTTGWYADVLLHHSSMGPVTAVARVEKLEHTGAGDDPDLDLGRQTVGARVRLADALSLNVNVAHQRSADDTDYRPNVFDVGLTLSVRAR